MKKTLYFAIVFLLSSSIAAQEKWTLRQCIDHAIENNIEIKQQELQVKNSELSLSTSKNAILPDLNAGVDQRFRFGRSPKMVNDPANPSAPQKQVYDTYNTASSSLSISSSMPLFTGLRNINQIKQDKINLQAATEGLKKAKENLELQVTSYFLEVLFKKEIHKIYEEQIELTKKQVVRTQELFDAGKSPESQLYDIKAQLAKDELNTVNSKNDLNLSLLNLAQQLNLREYTTFDIVEPNSVENDLLENSLLVIQSPSDVFNQAINVKPHVKEAEYNLESKKKGLSLARSYYYPTLSLNLGYGTSFTKVYGEDLPTFKRQFRDMGSEYIGLSLQIPIFNRFQTRNRVRAAKLDITNQQLVLDNVKLALYKEIQQAYQSSVAAQAKYISTEKAYDAAAESYKYAEERYAVGKMTVFELAEAQTKLLSSKSEQLQAKYDFLFRTKILDFYRGEQIDIH